MTDRQATLDLARHWLFANGVLSNKQSLDYYKKVGLADLIVTPLTYLDGDNTFEPPEDEEETGRVSLFRPRLSAVIEALHPDGESVVDLVAWPIDAPSNYIRLLGFDGGAEALGMQNIARVPADGIIEVCKYPQRYAQALARNIPAICILDAQRAGDWLRNAKAFLRCEDVPHSRAILRIVGKSFDQHRVGVRAR